MTEKPVVGKVVAKNGKYFLEAERTLHELPAGLLVDETHLKDLVGHEVEVMLSEPQRFVVAILPKRPRIPITCYIPFPWWRNAEIVIDKVAGVRLAKRFLEEGVINKGVYEKITKGYE
jgi:hypothetical protein